jgi:hypothetical protein
MTTTIIVLASVIALVLILTLLMGNEMRIERSISIDNPIRQVFEYLKITKNQDNFSTWNMTDPTMKKEYQGTDGQVGFIYKWDSPTNKNVGAGEQEIKRIEEGKCIEYEIRFLRPMKNVASSKFVVHANNTSQTQVSWLFSGPTKFPMTLLKPIFQNMLGKDLEKGLKTLKTILENSL